MLKETREETQRWRWGRETRGGEGSQMLEDKMDVGSVKMNEEVKEEEHAVERMF